MLELLDRIGRNQLAAIDDDDFPANRLHFGKNVRAENNGVIAREALDQFSRFGDLFWIETRCGLIKNQHIGIVNNGLRQTDALPVSFRQFRDQLVSNVGDRAPLHHLIRAGS